MYRRTGEDGAQGWLPAWRAGGCGIGQLWQIDLVGLRRRVGRRLRQQRCGHGALADERLKMALANAWFVTTRVRSAGRLSMALRNALHCARQDHVRTMSRCAPAVVSTGHRVLVAGVYNSLVVSVGSRLRQGMALWQGGTEVSRSLQSIART